MDITPGKSAPATEELGCTVNARSYFSVHAVANKAYLILIRVFSDEQCARDQGLHSVQMLVLVTHVTSTVHLHMLL